MLNGVKIELTQEQLDLLKSTNKKELPKKWEDLKAISGYYVKGDSTIHVLPSVPATYDNKNMFKLEEEAEATIALAQLSQLKYIYNDGWIPDWASSKEDKYVILFDANNIITSCTCFIQRFLTFKTSELRDEFLLNFKDLIEQAKPLL